MDRRAERSLAYTVMMICVALITGALLLAQNTVTTVPKITGVGSTGGGSFASPTFTGTSTFSGPIYASDGTLGAPSYSFTSEPTLGFWRSGAGAITVQATNLFAAGAITGASGSVLALANKWNMYGPSVGALVMRDATNVFGTQFKFDALPTVASGFGTGPAVTAGSTPLAGSVNVGTGGAATTGVINFNGTAYPSAPFCTLGQSAGTFTTYTATATQLTLSAAVAWPASTVVTWQCLSSK